MSIRRSLVSLLIVLAIPTLALAANDVGKMITGGSSVEWQISASNDSVELIVRSPEGEIVRGNFANGKNASVKLSDFENAVDGTYIYELRVTPKISSDIKKKLSDARAKNDDKAIAKLRKQAGIDRAVSQSGAFGVLHGSVLSPDVTEPTAKDSSARSGLQTATEGVNRTGMSSSSRLVPEVNSQVIPDDLIVQGSACVGLDCVSTESFGFDTIRLKENNLRIHYDDTSTSAGFPNNDWRLSANDSASGGANKFTIDDATNSKVPFTIEGNTPTNSLYVDSTGNIGFGNSSPGLDLHITTSDTPAMRYEQTNAGGFTAQTWDIGANEANFFVRDLTGGSRLSFRIRPGAPTSSVDISASGDVGIGTGTPGQKLDVFEDLDDQTFSQVRNPNTGVNANATFRSLSDVATFDVKSHSTTRTISRFGKTLGGFNELLGVAGNGVILGTQTAVPLVLGTNSVNRLEIGGSGGVTVTGNFTVTGGTKNFAVVDPANAKKAIYFAALEGPEAGTYYRGTAKTVDGKAVIELPGYFSRITEKERMTVQLTPNGAWGQLYVAEKTPERLVVMVPEGAGDLEFDYLVQGVRLGYLDFEVERQNNLPK